MVPVELEGWLIEGARPTRPSAKPRKCDIYLARISWLIKIAGGKLSERLLRQFVYLAQSLDFECGQKIRLSLPEVQSKTLETLLDRAVASDILCPMEGDEYDIEFALSAAGVELAMTEAGPSQVARIVRRLVSEDPRIVEVLTTVVILSKLELGSSSFVKRLNEFHGNDCELFPRVMALANELFGFEPKEVTPVAPGFVARFGFPTVDHQTLLVG